MNLRPAYSTLFPYTTLFRSRLATVVVHRARTLGRGRSVVAPRGRRHRRGARLRRTGIDRKSIRLNSSHVETSYAVFCLKKRKAHVSTPLMSAVRVPRSGRDK